MEVDDSQFIISINQQVTRNKENGLPLNTEITTEKFERFLRIIRGNRSLASSVSSGKKAKPKVAPMETSAIIDLFK